MGTWRSFFLQIVCSLENLFCWVNCLGSSASKFLGLLQQNFSFSYILFFYFILFFFYLTSLLLAFVWAFLKRLLITNIKYFLIKSSGDESLFFCCWIHWQWSVIIQKVSIKKYKYNRQSSSLRKWWRKTFSTLSQISLKKLHKLQTWFSYPFFMRLLLLLVGIVPSSCMLVRD